MNLSLCIAAAIIVVAADVVVGIVIVVYFGLWQARPCIKTRQLGGSCGQGRIGRVGGPLLS